MSQQPALHLIDLAHIAAPSFVRQQNGHDKEGLQQLAASISTHGLLQPIVVRPIVTGTDEATTYPEPLAWIVVAGRRRVAACKLAGMTHVPALVTDTDETKAYELEIAENIQREQMTLADTARAVRTLMAIYDSAKKVAEILNKSPAWVSKHLSVTSSRCPPVISDMMDRGIITDLETLILLKQIAEVPASNPAAAPTMTRMLRIANDGNINRQIARDALAKLKTPAAPATTSTTTGPTRITTTRTVQPTGESTDTDPQTHFHIALPIALLAKLEELGGIAWVTRAIEQAEPPAPATAE